VVQAAHRADVVIAEETHDQVTLAQQVAPLRRRELRVLPDGSQQKLLQLQHFGDIPPVEHTAHQDKKRQRMRLQVGNGTHCHGVQYRLRVQGCEQDARVLFHNAQSGIVISALPIGRHGLNVLPVLLIPRAQTLAAAHLHRLGQCQKGLLGAFFHHVVKAIGHAIRQAGDKGVLSGQRGEQLIRVGIPGDKAGHLHGKLIGQTHDRQKLPLFFRQRIDHGGGEGGVDVGIAVWQCAALGKRPQIQIHGGKPALAGIKQRVHLGIGKVGAAAVGINGQLRVIQPQLFRADPVDPISQPKELCGGEKTVTACNDQMRVAGQTPRQRAEKTGNTVIRQQVEVIDKQILL